MPTRSANQPPQGVNRGQGPPPDRRSRGAGNGTTLSVSVQPKLESTMMIGDEQQQQDDQQDPVLVLGEDLQPPAVVNVDVSEDLLAAYVIHDKKTLFWLPVRLQDRTVWALIDTGASPNLISMGLSSHSPTA